MCNQLVAQVLIYSSYAHRLIIQLCFCFWVCQFDFMVKPLW
uniref:Uncharacterized protein n=1 Tax=Arundo donax TaxID=35708 RepID=A0A0A8YWS5_ARUDO